MMKIRFGVGLAAGPEARPERLPHLVDRLESAGIDSLWFSELVYTDAVDPFIGMAHALARTTKLKVGTSVMILPGRHPVLVAKQLASLAALAPKRVLPVFGLRSALPAERDVFVVPDGQRAAVFDESLRLLKMALAGDGAHFAGDFFTATSIAVGPHSAKPLDIWLGGSAPLRSVASAGSPTAGWGASSPLTRHDAGVSSSRPPLRRLGAPSNPTTTGSTWPWRTAGCPTTRSPRSATVVPTSTRPS